MTQHYQNSKILEMDKKLITQEHHTHKQNINYSQNISGEILERQYRQDLNKNYIDQTYQQFIIIYMQKYNYLFKFNLIGQSQVGKTSILNKFALDVFNQTYIQTIGMQFSSKLIQINQYIIKLQIWDIMSLQRSAYRSFLKMAIGTILIYDINNYKSFKNCMYYLKEIKQFAPAQAQYILVGNKYDKQQKQQYQNNRAVNFEEGLQFAKDNNMFLIECSAKTGLNINQIFSTLSQKILNKIVIQKLDYQNLLGIKVKNNSDLNQKISLKKQQKSNKCFK